MLYNDRKMKKWQGFVLSEHGASLAEEKQKSQRVIPKKEQQTEETIGRILQQAFQNQKKVSIQMNYLKNGLLKEDITGIIRGFEDGNIYVLSHDKIEVIDPAMIRNIEPVETKKWYQ